MLTEGNPQSATKLQSNRITATWKHVGKELIAAAKEKRSLAPRTIVYNGNPSTANAHIMTKPADQEVQSGLFAMA